MTAPAGGPRPEGTARRLDRKLGNIAAGRYTPGDFVIADAKDADMAFGVRAPGPRSYLARGGARPGQFSPEVWTREEFGQLAHIVEVALTVR